MSLPTGTITFLFTDIEGSTKLWERCPEAMRLALARHDALLREAIERHNGHVFKTVGDAFCAAFPTAPGALNAALEAHLALQEQNWGETGPIRVRMELHTGEAEERDNDYFGRTLNRVARLQGIGHGQQTLLSQATYELISEQLPADTTLSDMGMHRLKDLAAPEHVRQLLHPALPSEFPPLKSLDYLPTNLPAQLTSFIGREKEMADIKALLTKTRLLTLTGSGGAGKTRLSLQAAAEVLEMYPEGVWVVELAALSDPSLVAQTVAEVLGVREAPGEPITRTLLSALKDKAMLLVLDNCEHLLEAAARLVEALLKSCPKVSVLISSRESLGVPGESAYRVPSLALPPLPSTSSLQIGGMTEITLESVVGYESVRLFIERAVAVRADFTVTPQNASALASVCHRLDGIPLAIELAAARLRSLSVEEIDIRLDNRFRLLTGGSRTALPRQQTLRALIDWSYDLLEENQKALLLRLSVFAGGWKLETAEQFGADGVVEEWEVLDLLTALTDKSLVVYEERAGTSRYRLLETVRQYAREKLIETGGAEEARERHRDCFLALAEQAEPQLLGAGQAEWLQRLEEEHENLRAALDWSLLEPAGASSALRLCGVMQRFWGMRGYLTEGREWSARTLSNAGVQERTPGRARVLNSAAILAWMQGDYASARAYLEESLEVFRELNDRNGIAHALSGLGATAYLQGDYLSARASHTESLTLFRELGSQSGMAASLNNLGMVAYAQSDFPSALVYQQESLALWRTLKDRSNTAELLNNLGAVAQSQGDYPAAIAYYAEGLAIKREIGDRRGIALTLNNLGNVTRSQSNSPAARAYHEESLAISRETGDRAGIAFSLSGLGAVAQSERDFLSARTYYEESLALVRELGDRKGIALALSGLGIAACTQGDYASGRTALEESTTISQEIGDRAGIAAALNAFAELNARENKMAQAARLWGAAEALREEIGSPLSPEERERYDRNVAEARQSLGEEQFSTTWAEGRAMPLDQSLSYALEANES